MSYTPIVKHLRSSDGNPIYAEAIGNPKNPHVILVHGVGLSAATFNNLFEDKRLLDKVYLVRYDLRGHGRSGMPRSLEAYASSLFADDYAEVIRAFDLKHFGWSYGSSIAVDVCANLSPNPIGGIVYVNGLPYVGMMPKVGTPTVAGFVPGMVTSTDVALNGRTKLAFMDSLFANPECVDFDVKTSWIGQASLQPPDVPGSAEAVRGRREGLPLLILGGTADKQVMSDIVIKEMGLHFKDIDVVMVDGGSHALFYDFQDEVVAALLKFTARVAWVHAA
ncbi:alpha/beta-hydrolase [Daedalea quercina L-15889]|uniref:Alpha/beta-hydrolase n=1 Tax=Daedalea quercina L-15889 TaxID=1314783 RepID=A0A165LWN8_9APHY|nr:alpha/beta-hydrolase [Daedalea quercina L-15889]